MSTWLHKPRYSLRSILVAVTAVAMWLGLGIEKSRREAIIAQLVRDRGGYVKLNHDESSTESRIAHLLATVRHAHYPRVHSVSFHHKHADELLPYLRQLSHLREIYILARLSEERFYYRSDGSRTTKHEICVARVATQLPRKTVNAAYIDEPFF